MMICIKGVIMKNKLREIFDPNSEYNQKCLERIKEIEKELIADKHCSFCQKQLE